MVKIAGQDNPADAMTKYLSRDVLARLLGAIGVEVVAAPQRARREKEENGDPSAGGGWLCLGPGECWADAM